MYAQYLITLVLGFWFFDGAVNEAQDAANLPVEKLVHGDLNPDGKDLKDFFELTRRAGFTMYKIHEFELYPDISWKDLVKNASESQPASLTDITGAEIEKLFNLNGVTNKYVGPPIKFDVHSFEVTSKDLFPSSSEWYLENNGKTERIKPDGDIVISNAREVRLLEKKKDGKTGISILFDLGPKFETMRHAMFSEIKSGQLHKGKEYDVIMSHPRLQVIVKGGVGKIKYIVSMLALNESMKFPVTQSQMEGDRALQIITNITYYLLSHPDLVEKVSTRHIGITYSYQDIIISMKDYGFQTLLSNWTSIASDKSVKINLYGAMKTALINPFAVFRFNTDGDLMHKHHEIDFGGLHTPKGMNFERDFFPGFIYSGSNTDNPELENWITKRVLNISKRVQEEGIDVAKLGDIQDWMQNMIREDFRKFRMGGDNVTFHVFDEHFAALTLLKANDEVRLTQLGANIPRKGKKKREMRYVDENEVLSSEGDFRRYLQDLFIADLNKTEGILQDETDNDE